MNSFSYSRVVLFLEQLELILTVFASILNWGIVATGVLAFDLPGRCLVARLLLRCFRLTNQGVHRNPYHVDACVSLLTIFGVGSIVGAKK